MKLFQPKSTLQLVLYGFGFVSMPLLISLGYAAFYVDRLAGKSQYTVYQSVQFIQNSQLLLEQVTAMERKARQYLILGDKSLLKAYFETHAQFVKTSNNFFLFPMDKKQKDYLQKTVEAEKEIHDRLKEANREIEDKRFVTRSFVALTGLAKEVLTGSYRLIDKEVRSMQKSAAKAQGILFWFAVALIPITLISVAIFTSLIARPIRQVDQAIRQLGDGEFQSTIVVQGPQDLQYLGRRLDWLRQRLIELEEQKTRFLRHVSHELKTPLTAIREGGELLGDKLVGPLNPAQSEIVRILRTNSFQLQKLIEDLLNFSTVSSLTPKLVYSSIDVARIIEEVLDNHKPAMMGKSIRLEKQIEDLKIQADEEKLRTVIDNLLSNAIKFSPEHGCITVKLTSHNGNAVLNVSDDGPGIDHTDRDRVFDAFYQGKRQAEGYIKGSGLGLSIAREYVVAHEGDITVLDEQRQGADIKVTLPINQMQEAR